MNACTRPTLLVPLLAALAACGGGSALDPQGSAPPPAAAPPGGCTGSCAGPQSRLRIEDVERVLAQAVHEARSQNSPATIAVVDRVGNVLGVLRMDGAREFMTISAQRGIDGGLENLAVVPTELAAISKAITGAYLSSEGNAFSTRTANQIVQEHFNPGEFGAPSGPLFGVQFSQLACSDLISLPTPGRASPGVKPAPLGLAADPGGFPLYREGVPVGGVGVVAGPIYGLDPNLGDLDRDVDELIALAASFGYGAPLDRRADRITVEGKTLRWSDVEFSDLASSPSTAPTLASVLGQGARLIEVPLFAPAALTAGSVFGEAGSGIRPDTLDYAGRDAFVLVDGAGSERFRPRAGNGLSAPEVREILSQALGVANEARAQIRRPFGTPARVSISVVDANGTILGIARSRDAPVFGLDVSLQKARSAAFLSAPGSGPALRALPPARQLNPDGTPSGRLSAIGAWADALEAFLGQPGMLTDGRYAITPRAIGNLHRPYFPDGIVGRPPGPLSHPFGQWSPFNVGLQLDLNLNALAGILGAYLTLDPSLLPSNCTGLAALANGLQIFPGAVPIYRGNALVGAIGVSGDGIDQDDMIALLGVERAAQVLRSGFGNAPRARRIDQLAPQGARLRYVQCPQAPFLGSTAQNVCEGL